jgi:hypothetical protein
MSRKILIGINTLTAIGHAPYVNHVQLFFNFGKQIEKYFSDTEVYFFAPFRMSIDNMRNEAARLAIKLECDELIFIDDDVLVNPDAIVLLLESDFNVTAGITPIRGYPYHTMLFDFTPGRKTHFVDDWKERANDIGNHHVICDAVGFSCCRINVDLLKKIEEPWFLTGPQFTEDVYFCCKAKQLVPDVTIGYDARIKTGHMMTQDAISPDDIDIWKKFDEARNPQLLESEEKKDKENE